MCAAARRPTWLPSNWSGEEVTVKSDIYSLGLLLYEVFTGKAAFDGKTLEEIVRVRRDSTPSRPSSLVKDLDPAVEHAILHCLETDPDGPPCFRAGGGSGLARRRSAGSRARRRRDAVSSNGRRRR